MFPGGGAGERDRGAARLEKAGGEPSTGARGAAEEHEATTTATRRRGAGERGDSLQAPGVGLGREEKVARGGLLCRCLG